MVEHAVRTKPYECCGMLTSTGSTIDGIYLCENETESRTRFFVPPSQLFEFFRRVRENKVTFAGIYHSHPEGDPVPSRRDIDEFHYPETSYWVISLKKARPSVRCYRWDADSAQFMLEAFHIVSDPGQHYLSTSKSLSGSASKSSPNRSPDLMR